MWVGGASRWLDVGRWLGKVRTEKPVNMPTVPPTSPISVLTVCFCDTSVTNGA